LSLRFCLFHGPAPFRTKPGCSANHFRNQALANDEIGAVLIQGQSPAGLGFHLFPGMDGGFYDFIFGFVEIVA